MSLSEIIHYIIPYLTIKELGVLSQVIRFDDNLWGLILQKKFSTTISYKDKVKLYCDNSVEFSETKRRVFKKLYGKYFDVNNVERIFKFLDCQIIFSTFDGKYFRIDNFKNESESINPIHIILNDKDIENLFDLPLRERIYPDSKFEDVFNRKECEKLDYYFIKEKQNYKSFSINQSITQHI